MSRRLFVQTVIVTAALLALSSLAWGTTYIVDSTDDSGPGTLREALDLADDGDTIGFDAAVSGSIVLQSTLVVEDNVEIQGPGASVLAIDGNDAVRVFEVSAADATIQDLTISGGFDTHGAGIEVLAGARLTLVRCIVSDCHATNTGFNGGAGIRSHGELVVLDSTITNNAAPGGAGGGIWMTSGSSLEMNRSSVTHNEADRVTAIGGTSADLDVRNSLIAHNVAHGSRAGLYGQGTGQTHVVENVTITDNDGGGRGAFYPISGNWTVRNLTVVGNTPYDVTIGNTSAEYANNVFGVATERSSSNNSGTSLGYNVIADPTSTGGWIGSDMLGNSRNPLALDLDPLADYGGPSETMMPQPSSPVIGFVGGNAPDTDQRGLLRIGTPDAGAVQTDGAGPFAITPDPVSRGSNATLTGERMDELTAVTIGGEPASLGTASATSLEVTVSTATPLGADQVVEVSAGGLSQDWLRVEVVDQPPPSVTSVSPDPVAPGEELTIAGTDLAGANVLIGGVSTTVLSNTATEIVVQLDPSHPEAPDQTVAVTTSSGVDDSLTVTVAESDPGNGDESNGDESNGDDSGLASGSSGCQLLAGTATDATLLLHLLLALLATLLLGRRRLAR